MHSDLPFMSERMNIDKSQKIVSNMYNNKNYTVHIKTLKLPLIPENAHWVIEFKEEAWLTP